MELRSKKQKKNIRSKMALSEVKHFSFLTHANTKCEMSHKTEIFN